jgi:hypothetical protein
MRAAAGQRPLLGIGLVCAMAACESARVPVPASTVNADTIGD